MTRARDAADQINILNSSAADATAITIDSSENVGIGTSSPATPLDVTKAGGGNFVATFQNTTSATPYGVHIKDAASGANGYPLLQVTNSAGSSPYLLVHSGTGNVGIGTSSPDTLLELVNLHPTLTVRDSDSTTSTASSALRLAESGASDTLGSYWDITAKDAAWQLAFTHSSSGEAMRIDSSGNLLVGRTSTSDTAVGAMIRPDGFVQSTRDGNIAADFNRNTSDGDIVRFSKGSSPVGSIGTANSGDLYIGNDDTTLLFAGGSDAVLPRGTAGAARDNVIDLGASAHRFNDIYATNGTIQTSDANEKQDIEVLSDAETRVAQACKGLLRKFRWIDAVEEKGDNARIHFGIIAQDLQDAFTAEGLDAGRYAMFISSTWWETQTDVPAVEAVESVYEDVVIPAVLDEDGNELEAEHTEQRLVTEAVEAKDAYTRTDTFDTLAEAPEGATERTRLGVRYPELLAFIIGAM